MAAPTPPDITATVDADADAVGSEHGAVATEYAIMASLIAIMIIGGVTVFGQAVRDMFDVAANFWP